MTSTNLLKYAYFIQMQQVDYIQWVDFVSQTSLNDNLPY